MKNRRVPNWKLERYLLGELAEKDMVEIRQLDLDCPEVHEELESLRRLNRDFKGRFPSETVIPRITRRLEEEALQKARPGRPRRPAWRRLLIVSPVVASALIILLIVFKEPPSNRIKGDESVDPTKVQIVVYRKSGRGIEMLKNGDRVRAGDLLQLAYVPAGQPFGVIASLDGDGVATLHFPEKTADSTRLKQDKKVMLETAYELDRAPRYECFYFVTSSREIDVADVLGRIKAAARRPDFPRRRDLELPESQREFSLLLEKGDGE